jgi:hypothetical protein
MQGRIINLNNRSFNLDKADDNKLIEKAQLQVKYYDENVVRIRNINAILTSAKGVLGVTAEQKKKMIGEQNGLLKINTVLMENFYLLIDELEARGISYETPESFKQVEELEDSLANKDNETLKKSIFRSVNRLTHEDKENLIHYLNLQLHGGN